MTTEKLTGQLRLACALALAVAAGGPLSSPDVAAAAMPLTASPGLLREAGDDSGMAKADADGRLRYIVVLDDSPVALYEGTVAGIPRIPRLQDGRLDVNSTEAQRYVDRLAAAQDAFTHSLPATLGRAPVVEQRLQHAINALVLELTPEEAQRLGSQPGVRFVEADRLLPLDTDIGPQWIQADQVWDGSGALHGLATRGEGIVVGIIDSGINFDSPAFAALGPVSGHSHVNPLGGSFLGSCAPGGVDAGKCNAKLIGAYDFVYSRVCTPAAPATDPCRAGDGSIIEEPSAVDSNGHGTHVASTVAGNAHAAQIPGAAIPISGVAPHASLIAYDACYTRRSDGNGLCPNTASLAAVNQAVADGIVNVINYSIGGGEQPWSDAVSIAFLGATNAGIFVATSAGNAGPGAGTLGHVEPWTTAVAATTHDRARYAYLADVDDGAPTPGPQDVEFELGAAGAQPSADITAPLLLSSGYANASNAAADGCLSGGLSPYAPASLTGTVVVILRGTCPFAEKAKNAEDAGALAVIIANNQSGRISPAATLGIDVQIPVYGMQQADALAIRTHVLANAPSSIAIPRAPSSIPSQPDIVASFSSRGPSFYDLVKPDVAAPGVGILAAYSGAADATATLQGTSMASPHVAGAAALLRALHPTWSPSQVKSALMLTANGTTLVKADGSSASDPWERGAGLVAVADASRTGLVMDESTENFLAADPAQGGNPATLNLASIAQQTCVGTCTFSRTFRSARSGTVSWTVSATGELAPAIVSPGEFVIGTGQTRTVSFGVDARSLPSDRYSFGSIVLTPSDATLQPLSIPVAVRAAPPILSTTPGSLSAAALPGEIVTRQLLVRNVGNPTLSWALDDGSVSAGLLNLPQTGNGFRSQQFSSFDVGDYLAEDFAVPAPATLTRIHANGFVLPGGMLLSGGSGVARGLTVQIYADADGQPAGTPELGGSAPVWSYAQAFATPGTMPPGISMAGNNITIEPAATGVPPPALQPGRYWVSITPWLNGSGTGSGAANPLWAWRTSDPAGEGNAPVGVFPFLGDPGWEALDAAGLSTYIEAALGCGVPWASADIAQDDLDVGGETVVTVTFDAGALGPGLHQGVLCLASNDSNNPLQVVPISFTVTAPSVDPSGTGLATPPVAAPGSSVLLTVTTVPGANPPSSALSVVADLAPIGGSDAQAFVDDGAGGDAQADDGTFSFTATIPLNATPGAKLLPVTISDAQARSGTTSIALTLASVEGPSGIGEAFPAAVSSGQSALLAVSVDPGNPPGTGIAVSIDLTAVGGAPDVALVDDGTQGDLVAGDGVYSLERPITGELGSYLLPVTITDDQARVGVATVGIAIIGESVFRDGFEDE